MPISIMELAKDKNFLRTIGVATLAAVAVGVAFFSSTDFSLIPTRATVEFSTTLNQANAPTLSGGSGTMTDDKNITWEYSGCSSYASGHVRINADGYFGVSSSTVHGYTFINSVTASFTKSATGELWLLTSVDGLEWNERGMLKTNEPTNLANNWRYIRFFNNDPSGVQIEINSVNISYACLGGISSTEDLDSAKIDNVNQEKLSFFTATRETSLISPKSVGGEAIRLTNTAGSQNKTHVSYIHFDRDYTIGEIKYWKLEFDYRVRDKRSQEKINRGFPKIKLQYDDKDVSNVLEQGGQDIYSERYPFIKQNLGDDWWHLEYFITAMAPTVADYDKPTKETSLVNGVRISDGYVFDFDSTTAFVIVDNLRFGCTSSNKLGIFNNTSTATVNTPFWFKTGYSGIIRSCTFTFTSEDGAAIVQDTSTVSKFYFIATHAGTADITVHVLSGYNESSAVELTITNRITIS